MQVAIAMAQPALGGGRVGQADEHPVHRGVHKHRGDQRQGQLLGELQLFRGASEELHGTQKT